MARNLLLFLLSFLSLTIFSQITENFSDGDFTANPTWAPGAPTDFTVAGGQLKSANTTSNTSFYISTSNTLASNCTWEFWVNLQFATSGANYVDAYLLSDNSNLTASNINGYFVRIGNTSDDISLYKSTAGTQSILIDGVNSSVASSSNNLIKIKVTRTTANQFTLERDMTGTGSSYLTEGSITDATFTTTSAFGFAIKQSTASFFGKHLFDDINIATIVVDVTPPSISNNTVVSNTQLDVLFSEPVELTTSQTLSNYNADNSLGNPSAATRDGSNLALVHLTFASTFSNATVNTLTVVNVQDNSANAISTATTSFTYFAPIVLGYKDIIINEIMAAPHTTLNAYRMEYIELYNRSSNPIDLNGLKLADTYTGSGATLSSYILQPNSYVAICTTNSATALSAASGNTNVIGVASFPSLSNAGDNIYLKSGSTLIDSVNYLDSWYQNATKKNGGWSLELINPNQNFSCAQASNWIASNDPNGGTPGYINSVYSTAPDLVGPNIISVTATDSIHITVCFNDLISISQLTNTANYSINNSIGSPTLVIAGSGNTCATLFLSNELTNLTNYTITVSGITDCNGNAVATPTANFLYFVSGTPNYKDIVINEIYADPSPIVHLTTVEFVELYNRSSNPFDLTGMKFTNGSTTATLGSYALLPGKYVVICPVADTAQFTAIGVTNKLGVSSFPALTNSGDDLYLKTSGGAFLDSVRYSDTWYRNSLKNDGGWTLEQINPDLNFSCLQANNWVASFDTTGGTPGKVNSAYSTAPDLTGPKVSDVFVVDSMHVTVCFNDVIAASQLNLSSNYVINDTLGNIVAVASASAQAGNMCVDLTLTSKLTNPNSYTLTISGITDCNANALNPNKGYFSRYTAKPFDVVINEIMADPTPAIDLPEEEYVELKNRTNYYINLKNWSFSSLSTSKKLSNMTIAPNGYLVLAGSDTYNQFYNNFGIVVHEVPSFPSLLDYGTTISLKDTTNTVISSVSYESSWYNDPARDNGGWSLEQIDANNPCGGQTNWHASTNVSGGTPGSVNSVAAVNPDNVMPLIDRAIVISADTIAILFNEPLDSLTLSNPANYSFNNGLIAPTYIKPIGTEFKKVILKLSAPMQLGVMYHCTIASNITDCVGNPLVSGTVAFALPDSAVYNDVVINEVLFDPNTGGVDFVELYNRSNKTIDLKDLNIGSMDTLTGILKDTEIITEEGYLLFPETYLVISETGKSVKQQYATPNPQGFLDIVDLPSMNTDDDVVTLSRKNGTIIDNLKYTSKMHFPLLVSTKGVSLERIDFNRSTDDRTNWNSAAEAVGFATPAYRNSQYLQADGGSGWVISNPLFSPDNDGYNDVLNITYKLDEPGKAANIFIYDSKGRLVRHLVKNEQLATDGVISWNGINDDNEKASIGIYVIYIETFNLSGKVNKYKLSCTLAGKLN